MSIETAPSGPDRREYQAAYYVANRKKLLACNATNRAADLEAYRARDRHRYVENRDALATLKAGPCLDCGVSYPPCVMDFDHRPGSVKVERVASLVAGSRERLLAEVAKCDLVCANCHRLRTADRRDNLEP